MMFGIVSAHSSNTSEIVMVRGLEAGVVNERLMEIARTGDNGIFYCDPEAKKNFIPTPFYNELGNLEGFHLLNCTVQVFPTGSGERGIHVMNVHEDTRQNALKYVARYIGLTN